jgi:hypothetical protein
VAVLHEWLLLFVDFLDAKKGMAEARSTLIGDPDALYRETPPPLAAPITALIDRAVKTGPQASRVLPLLGIQYI